MKLLGCFLMGYLFGSFPTGLLLVRMLRGEDIRNYGSGNIGATNVGRLLGKPAAIGVALADMIKGGLGVLAARLMGITDPGLLALVGFAGVCGHNFPVWLHFRGGKGVATSFGVFFFLGVALQPSGGILWLGAPLGGLLWYLLLKTTRFVSLSSIVSVPSMALIFRLLGAPWEYSCLALALGGLTMFRHSQNIRRLLNGTESRVGEKKKEPSSPR
ncbi:MAG TPA: glycerol-3-phosphate 1-O-acyltransferase PlsY [Synergistaceae bacterium]|nr:glycerol-3-phosphate 1-O-acyltransferase PlsY [Synergistaceae bacterium]HPQ37481.1 glycerol-3-phosphate 1-O-acyltransferase PlsY [Synergistaceae bacterium]